MKKFRLPVLVSIAFLLTECQSKPHQTADYDSKAVTPVTVTSPEFRSIAEVMSFRSVSAFQKKNVVKANITGYVERTYVNIGDQVRQGQVLFDIQTKEAKALANFSGKDSLLRFKGESSIHAPSSGIVTEVNKQINDYLNDGDQMCVIAEKNSFVFLLNVPFEKSKMVTVGKNCRVILPDSTSLSGIILAKLSTIDPASQTQVYVVKPQNSSLLSENLSAVIQIVKNTRVNAQVLNKSCVLSDETLDNFWVMKMINDSTAVKIQVKKGITNDSKIEILSPVFSPSDRIIQTGSYGLADTAYVRIIKP